MGKPTTTPQRKRTTAALSSSSAFLRRKGVARRPANGGRVNQRSTNSAFTRKWLETAHKERKGFDEELFTTTFSKENIEKLIDAAKNAADTEVAASKRLLVDDYIYSVQISSHRTPHIPVHLSRILLPHSIEGTESDICLFVKDLKRGRRLDFEPTIKHYEQLLRSKKVVRNITIIPVNQLYNDFATFELRRKLTYLYDRFLVDKTVATHVNGFLGHKLLMKGRSAIQVDLAKENLNEELESGLRKVFYKHVNNGLVSTVQVGRHSMTNEQIGENIIELVRQLGVIHPGGSVNIHKLYIKPNVNISVAVPIYVNLDKPTLAAPTETGPNESAMAEASEQAGENLENFDISGTGEVLEKVRQRKSIVSDDVLASDDEQDDEGTTKVVQSTPAKKNANANAANKRTGAAARRAGNKQNNTATDPAISDLIVKELKKIIGKGNQGNAGGASGSGGVANKQINRNNNRQQNQQQQQGGNKNPNNRNNQQGGNNRGQNRNNAGGNNRNFNSGNGGGGNFNRSNDFGNSSFGNSGGGGGSGYGGVGSGLANFDTDLSSNFSSNFLGNSRGLGGNLGGGGGGNRGFGFGGNSGGGSGGNWGGNSGGWNNSRF